METVGALFDRVLLDRNRALKPWMVDIGAAVVVAALAALAPVVHGIGRFALETPDADLIFIYEALAAGSGLAQEYFDHTGYLYFQLLAAWLKLLSALGMIPAAGLNDIPPPPAHEAAIAAAIQGGRVLSLILAAGAAVLGYAIARAVVARRWLAFLVAVLFAASSGLAAQSLILRTELPSMVLVLCYAMALLSCQRRGGWRGGVALVLATGFAGAAILVKIVALPLAILLALPFALVGWAQGGGPPATVWEPPPAQAAAVLVAGAALALPGIVSLWSQADRLEFYHIAIPGGITVLVAMFVVLYRRPWSSFFSALGFILAGSGLAFAFNLLRYNDKNIWVLANLTRHVSNFTGSRSLDLETVATIAIPALGGRLFDNSDPVSAAMFWFAAPTAIWLYSRGQRRRALCIGAFLAIWIAVLGVLGLRGAAHYLVYNQIIPLLAALLAADGLLSLPSARSRKWVGSVLAGGAVVLLILELRTALGPEVRTIQPRENICYQATAYLHRMPHSFDHYCR